MGRDSNLFATIRGYLPPADSHTANDDKLHKFREMLAGMPSEKVLVFTESAVTAKYIYGYLTADKKGKLNRSVAQIDSKQKAKDKYEAIRRFDPKNNGVPNLPKSEEIDILVSTDVLSEGVNLQAGRVVINYDFHWNPVKLIQRVGRIDRIGSEHEVVDVINFLPTTKIEERLSLKERVASKITLIRSIMGGDQKILEGHRGVQRGGHIGHIRRRRGRARARRGRARGGRRAQHGDGVGDRGRPHQEGRGGTCKDTCHAVRHEGGLGGRRAADSVRGGRERG